MNKTIIYIFILNLLITYSIIYIVNYFSITNYNKNHYYNLLNIKYRNKYINKKYSILLSVIILYYTFFFCIKFNNSIYFLEIYIFWVFFIIIAHIDAYTKTIPLLFAIIMICNGLFFGVLNEYISFISNDKLHIVFYISNILIIKNLINKIFGLLIIFIVFIIINIISSFLFNNKYNVKNFIGIGDIIILSAIGSTLGIEVVPLILFLASTLGIIYYLIIKIFFYKYKIKLLNKKLFDKNIYISIPFIPFLFMGTWITWILYYMKIKY